MTDVIVFCGDFSPPFLFWLLCALSTDRRLRHPARNALSVGPPAPPPDGGRLCPPVEAIQDPGTSQPASVSHTTKKMFAFVRTSSSTKPWRSGRQDLLTWPRRRRCRRCRRFVVSLNHRRHLISYLIAWRFAGKLRAAPPDSRAAQSTVLLANLSMGSGAEPRGRADPEMLGDGICNASTVVC